MDTVYIETSIVSYATAWTSQNTQVAALQQQAKDWWQLERPKFDLVTSQLTINEACAGDSVAAAARIQLLTGLTLLAISKDAEDIAAKILAGHMMPQKAPPMLCMLPLQHLLG